MNKTYNRINWKNYPSDETPLNAYDLNRGDAAIDEIDNRVIVLDNTKATKVEVSTLIKEVSYDKQTGIITFTRKNGATFSIDTPMEKIQTGIYYDPETEMLALPLIDGTTIGVDLSRLITEFEFMGSNTIAFSVKTDGKVTAIVKEGSIEEKHLRPDYLADIKVESAKAEAAATSAYASKTAAAASASTASSKASEASASAASAANSSATSTQKATEAATSAANAAISASTATTKANEAADSASNADNSATSAFDSATTATNKADAASTNAIDAANSSASANEYAKKSQSYAVGTGNMRPNEATDNAKYYYEQARDISQGLAGAIIPIGTVSFTNLPALLDVESGWMYNISDQFTTTSDFKEGAGNIIPAGANVYKTADGKWDVLAGTPVTSVNGETGNVKITAQNLNALKTNGDAKDTTVTFTSADVADGSAMSWTSVAKLTTGEKLSSILNKVSTMFKNVRWLYKMFGTTDISSIGDGTVSGAIASQNETLATVNMNLNKIGTYITANGDYVNVPSDGTEHMIAAINIDSGIWVITANIICWVTSGTNIYTRLFDSNGVERHYSVGTENNIVTTVILKTDAYTTVPVFVAHDDTNGARTFIATLIKAVRII